MSFKPHAPHALLSDMLEAIERIDAYTSGMALDDFQADPKTQDAVERCLQRLTEAAVRLGEVGPQLLPDQPWPDIRGMGNWLRHAYDRIDPTIIWNTIQHQLPKLKAHIQHYLNLKN